MPKFFEFSGRLSRKEYLKGTLVLILICILSFLLQFGLVSMKASATMMTLSVIALLLVWLVCTVSMFALTIRRLHDVELPGIISLVLLTGLGQIMMIILWFYPGTEGSNKYGPDPLSKD